jgi:hypothetical protein
MWLVLANQWSVSRSDMYYFWPEEVKLKCLTWVPSSGCHYWQEVTWSTQDQNETVYHVKPLRLRGHVWKWLKFIALNCQVISFSKYMFPPFWQEALTQVFLYFLRHKSTGTYHRQWSNKPESLESGTGCGKEPPGHWSPIPHQGSPRGGLRIERWGKRWEFPRVFSQILRGSVIVPLPLDLPTASPHTVPRLDTTFILDKMALKSSGSHL